MDFSDKTDTRQLILDAAIDMFSERGYKDVSIRDLAAKVGIKSASLYYYFPSKEDILSTLFDTYNLKAFRLLTYSNLDSLRQKVAGMTFEEVVKEFSPILTPEDLATVVKMTRITLREQFSYPRAKAFWGKRVFEETIYRWKYVLDVLVEAGQLPAQDTLLAAEISLRVSISYLVEMAHGRKVPDTEISMSFNRVMKNIFERMQRGEF